VVLFGARKLPEISKGLGQSIKDFKNAINDLDTIDVKPKTDSSKMEKWGHVFILAVGA